jgi:hypothetical protein
MLYFSSAPVRPDSVDEKQYGALKEFKQECYKKGLVESYDSLGEFRDNFSRQLSQTIIRFDPGPTPTEPTTPPSPTVPALSPEAKSLLIEAAADRNGRLMRIRNMGGMTVQTNNKTFANEGDPRSEARWERVIQELESLGLIEDRGFKREVFAVTDTGFRVADLVRGT